MHDDDESSMGGILQLARDIESEFRAITGEALEIIYDRDHLVWGDSWRERLTDAVGSAAFLIPFISPRFFQSDECRRELEYFQQIAASLGRGQLVLPVMYIEVEGLSENDTDTLRAFVAATQYEDWTDLRFTERTTSEYRRGVHRLARILRDRLAELPDPQIRDSDSVADRVSTGSIDADLDDDDPGVLERIAENEGSVEKMTAALLEISKITNELGEMSRSFTSRISSSNNARTNLANRLIVIGEYAKELEPLVARLEDEVTQYRAYLQRSDVLYRGLLEVGSAEPNRESARVLVNVIIGMTASATDSFKQTDGLIAAVQGMENYSRAIRKPSRRLQLAFQTLRDSEPVLLAWAEDSKRFLEQLDEIEGRLE